MNAGFALIVIGGILLLILAVIALWVIGIYNKLIRLRNRYENAFSQIDVQLKRMSVKIAPPVDQLLVQCFCIGQVLVWHLAPCAA